VRTPLLVALLALAAGAGFVSARRAGEQLAVLRACEAAGAGDWAAALAGSEGRTGPDETGLAALECRCRALLATGAAQACEALLAGALAAPEAAGWAPAPDLAVHWIETWREAGETRRAAELARRAGRLHPLHPDLFHLELSTRSSVEDERAVLRELEARLPASGTAALHPRASLANRYLLRGEPGSALAALGEAPESAALPAARLWFETRGMALARAGDLGGVQRHYAAWERAGADPAELRARYALTLSIAGLRDPERAPLSLLAEGARAAEALGDPPLHEALLVRQVLTLVNAGQPGQALTLYDRARERYPLAGLSRGELLRAARGGALAGAPPAARRGSLRFRVPAPAPGSTLLVSAGAPAEPDADYESFPVPASGRVEALREVGPAPERWVLRGAGGGVLASGAVSPRAAESLEVRVRPAPAEVARAPAATLARRPADGRRRVLLLLLDCADWRLVQYLRTRGELPVLEALLATGFRAVLASEPPLTAAALEALVHPGPPRAPSLLGWLHRYGTELAGLASVGENPLAGLAWLLPEQRDLFAELGAGPRAVANLLFAHGGMAAGRHALVTGPAGARRTLSLASSARDLSPAERARFPGLAALREERDLLHLRAIAAELDAAVAIAGGGEIDLLALRVEALDILTHAHFAEVARDAQDDGRGVLLDVYRYLDARLLDVEQKLDADDVLVVLSDHGIQTAMEHAAEAIFVASGAGLPRGRAPGRPALAGVPRALADLLGIATDWPDTGVLPVQCAACAAAADSGSPSSPSS